MSIKPHVHIIGNKGNMGRRYAAILKAMDVSFDGHDVDTDTETKENRLSRASHILICTPTNNHLDDIGLFLERKDKRSILCEKPFINDRDKFEDMCYLLFDANRANMNISMVDQYAYLNDLKQTGNKTEYSYFNSGRDGVEWDCINIIWQANGDIEVNNHKHYWKCEINGSQVDFRSIDHAYYKMILDWVFLPSKSEVFLIMDKHQKVLDYIDGKYSH